MRKCPSCGVALDVQITLDTDYSKISNMKLAEPAKPTLSGEDRYLALPWKRSLKKQNLGTILVSMELLQNPLARELYDRLKDWKTMRAGDVSYRYSKTDNGTEFLQKWEPIKE